MSGEMTPDVSVLVITYNHERYIGRALDSVLMQRGVDFEIIASEDRSTDRTLDIVRGKLAEHAQARIIASQRNLGGNQSVLRAVRAARGRYVSVLDGDDYWIVDDTLARQVALLDSDRSLAACAYNAVLVRGDGHELEEQRWTPATQSPRIGLADLWHGNPFAICGMMMRRSALCSLGQWYGEIGITDWPLYLSCAEHGDIAFVDEAVAAYRQHGAGCYSSLAVERKLDVTADVYRRMDAGLGYRYHRQAVSGAATYFTDWMKEHAARGEQALARRAAWHALRSGGISQAMGWRRWLRAAAGSIA